MPDPKAPVTLSRPTILTRAAALANAAAVAQAAVPAAAAPPQPRTVRELRDLGTAQSMLADLQDAKKRAAAALATQSKKSIADATSNFFATKETQALAERLQAAALAATEMINACHEAFHTVFNAFQAHDAYTSDEATAAEWHTSRVKTTWATIEAIIAPIANANRTAIALHRKMLECLQFMNRAAAADQLFAFSDDTKRYLSDTERPWAELFREHLSPNCLNVIVETPTPGMTVSEYVATNRTALHDLRAQWTNVMEDDVQRNLADITAITGDLLSEQQLTRICALFVTRQASVYDRLQQMRWIQHIDPAKNEEYTNALIALDVNASEVPFYEAAAADANATRAQFKNAPQLKKKSAPAAQQYVGVLDAHSCANHSLIRQHMRIGDTDIEATIDPGAAITLIDTAVVSSLNDNVARRAHHIAPTRIAAWNGTVSDDEHAAWLVAVRPIWCNEPHWVRTRRDLASRAHAAQARS